LGRFKERDRRDLLNAMQSVPSSTVSWRLSLLQDFALDHSQLSSLTQMVLLIASAGDRLLPSVEEGKRLVKSLPNAKLVVLPDSGHSCLLESDIKLAKMLRINVVD
jgi:pimeloyl-ACP methyl ester carboxylesterase